MNRIIFGRNGGIGFDRYARQTEGDHAGTHTLAAISDFVQPHPLGRTA
ncbi:MAG: hypothetical protein JJ956_16115 [Pseudomonadales bacterium]|nr:hypothetical protein [Pseudomonadales bacterium]